MTENTQIEIENTMAHFFNNEFEQFKANDGILKTEDSLQGWGEFVRTNLVETGIIDENTYNENASDIFRLCESALKEYKTFGWVEKEGEIQG